ncbi:MAG: ornithine cyclodeaminase family protein [Chloroflexota bacterium]|nr:ornithine cyclodeaminase family protein [Chloroflexota bacterium]
MAIYIDNEQVRELLPMDECIQAMEDAFRHEAQGLGGSLVRQTLFYPGGRQRLMIGSSPGFDTYGFKTYGGGVNLVLAFSTSQHTLEAIVESRVLSEIRTGAVAGLATKYMANDDASTIGVIGSGLQAKAQIEAICAVRPITKVKVYTRTAENREGFAEELRNDLALDAVAVETGEECISGSDVIVTATGSRDPVFAAEWLSPGAHINAIGATTPGRREIDEHTVGRCDVVVVESVAQAKVECGELMLAEDRGQFQWSQAVEMRHLVTGLAGHRPSRDAITLFNGLGVAMEDTAAAGVVLRKAKDLGLGVQLPIEVRGGAPRRIR